MKKLFPFLALFLCATALVTTGFFRTKTQTPADVFLAPSATSLHQKPSYRKVLSVSDNPGAMERAKIDYLIELVRQSPYTFIRNGVTHSGPRSATHLLWKYHRQVSKVDSAQKFIDEIATRSSLSGELYLVKLDGQKTYPLRDLLYNEFNRLKVALKKEDGATDNKETKNFQP